MCIFWMYGKAGGSSLIVPGTLWESWKERSVSTGMSEESWRKIKCEVQWRVSTRTEKLCFYSETEWDVPSLNDFSVLIQFASLRSEGSKHRAAFPWPRPRLLPPVHTTRHLSITALAATPSPHTSFQRTLDSPCVARAPGGLLLLLLSYATNFQLERLRSR